MALKPSPKEKKFLENYLQSFNKVAAYLAAGFRAKKGEEAAAAEALLLKYSSYLVELNSGEKKIAVDGDSVIGELAAIAFSKITDACTWDATRLTLLPSASLDESQVAAIKKISVKPGEFGTEFSVEMHDKKAALQLLAKHFNVDCSLNDLIARIRSYGYEVKDVEG